MKSANFVLRGLLAFVCLFLVVAMSYTSAESVCCDRPGAGGSCDDGTKPGTMMCCGVGKCNIFCCDCNGGCRKDPDAGKQSKKECLHHCESAESTCSTGCTISCTGAPSESCEIFCDAACLREADACKKNCESKYPSSAGVAHRAFDTFNAHDRNYDGHLSKDEFGDMVKKNNMGIDENREFEAMDKNKDGRISLEEADVPLPAAIQEKIVKKKKK